ncbi:hypothetical protein CFC21_010899 [Triticum aestivum]|uniref:Uncharacterized protein n=4 Tax=Triticinae TaxID=1648030 RepID=W5ANH4_WHEAT|nr:uncharacterized protein LOC109737616 [Aegilops tauschii subsp. strangulata]XP_037486763.1 uncharacterized protein LOC119365250 [Triticum dicoccoides]XP_044385490.1 uncharacterized protein LOC123107551 [Triticum aestivum]XP_044440423.1 uncharacterized protein LOC123166689 [Triticum aestivum]KAF6982975.1 hypothetical protein CFC21_001289 [Triticum aestivum]KAF6994113.1 hypothetical protein CFC21_010899 [Triticum aestivum]
MCHSPSGSRATARSGRVEEFADAATEEGGESKLSALLYDVSQQVQDSLQSMLKMTGEIEQCSDEIEVEIEQAKEGVADKYRVLEEEKERFQKVALAALNILSGGI